MCTLLLPDTFRAKAELLERLSGEARIEVARRVRRMRIGIGVAVALVIRVAIAMISTSART